MSLLLAVVLGAWLVMGVGPWLLPTVNSMVLSPLRSANILFAVLTTVLGLVGLMNSPISLQVSWVALPIPLVFYVDGWSAFFVFLLGLSAMGVTCYGGAYFKHATLKQQRLIQSAQGLFIFAMLMVFCADNVFTFLSAWELMTLSSYFLVVAIEPSKITRRAGFLYLGIAHLGFLAIVVSFFLLAGAGIAATFQQFVYLSLGNKANLIFLLALVGFGAKAGLFPLHVWLPEAHPAAPSPISALMSGVMLKTAIYGLIRFTFDFLLPYQQLWWGYLLVAIGLISMLIGVIHAAMQTDMKRLLAYSSMENIGFITVALGLAVIFYQYYNWSLAGLALLVVLLHSLNHSLFKSLLFLSTGSILHATGERNLGRLGGLIHPMPWVSACALVGSLSMAGLPLFNGFISEWIYLVLFFHDGFLGHFNFAVLSSLIVAISVLVFGLAAFVVVKFFGIAFLGQPRESQLTKAHPANIFERVGLGWLALGCLVLGLWPQGIVTLIQSVLTTLVPNLPLTKQSGWLIVQAPVTHATNSEFSPLFLGVILLIIMGVIFFLLRKLAPLAVRRATAWSCGLPLLTSRMQDTAEGFSQPFKQIFSHLIEVKLMLPKPNDLNPHYHSQLTEKIWPWFYDPLVKASLWIVSLTKKVQQGKTSIYLLYMGITLLVLLIWVVWL